MRALALTAGVATSVGPLPQDDPSEAAAFVLARQPTLPAAPSLPRRSPLERRLAQAAWGVPGVRVGMDGSLGVELSELDAGSVVGDPELEGEPFVTLRRFLDAVAGRSGTVKFQLTGPVSLGVALSMLGAPASTAFPLAASVTRQRAHALLQLVMAKAPQVTPVVMVDEPAFAGVFQPGFPIPLTDSIDLVSATLAAIEPLAVTGLRLGPGSDWVAALEAGPQLLVLPADGSVLAAAGALDRFLEDGGWLSWAAVPTQGPVGSTVDRLWRGLSRIWCLLVRAGVDPIRLRTQALVMPGGGLGRHSCAQATALLELADRLARRLHDQATGLRLSAGA